MFVDERRAVDALNRIAGKSPLDRGNRGCICLRLVVGGHQHRLIHNEEVGVGRGQPMTIVGVETNRGPRQWHQTVGVACHGAQPPNLLFKTLKLIEMRVSRIAGET